MNEIIEKENTKIEDMIYEIRGKQVMLDSDLAKLYKCTNGTKDINKAVKRNIDKFPDDFYFQITLEECNCISRFQNGTLNKSGNNRGNNIKYLPYAFTEQGVAMLSSVLKTTVASKVSVQIMRTFVEIRKHISTTSLEQKYINNMVIKHDNDIMFLMNTFSKFKTTNNEIYFNGQIYDAYSKIIDILKEAKKEIVIIDAYADKFVLDLIKNLDINVTLIVKKKSLLTSTDIEKYNQQYNNLKVIYNDTFHDRYFILDKSKVYHCGTSLNRIGTKTFSINRIEDNLVIDNLIRNVYELYDL